jgi:predicted  nucleic acid-binding Zn-ribbon protein
MAKHFDIGTWSKEHKQLKQKSLELNDTIAGLNEDISSKEKAIKDLKRKVGWRSSE